MRAVLCAIATGAALFLVACGLEELPTVPGELTTGIAIYEHADYAGASALITEDIKDLKDVEGPCEKSSGDDVDETWNDCISSIRLAPGWQATLFRDDGYEGEQLEVTGDIPNLELVMGRCEKGGFNDCVTAIRVFRR
ncbi:MAG TPA: hypothetical protein VM791_00275 [Vicinamibacterales bacterium]|nr:hypothetical protein [Vicinamibacterales bacterium]